MIVVIGGCDQKGLLKLPFTDAYHPDSQRWTRLPSLPGYARSEFATCTLRNDIYVSGEGGGHKWSPTGLAYHFAPCFSSNQILLITYSC